MEPRHSIRDIYDALSRPPADRWPDAVKHHGARALLLLIVAAAMYLLFPLAPLPDLPSPEVGDVLDRDIIARIDFAVYKTEAELARDQFEAAAVVPPTFRYDATAVDSMRSRMAAFMVLVDSAVAGPWSEAEVDARLRQALSAYSLPTRTDVLSLLKTPQHRRALWSSLDRTLRNDMPEGVARESELEQSRAPQVQVLRDGRDATLRRDSIVTASGLYERARANLPLDAPSGLGTLQQFILIRFLEPTLRLDREATEVDRESARQAVPIEKERVVAGERIIAAHEQVTPERAARFRAYRASLEMQGLLESGPAGAGNVLGAFTLNLLVLSIFGLLLFFYRPQVYANFRYVVLIAVLFLIVAGCASVIARSGIRVELVPMAFSALIIAALWDGRMALNFSLILAIALGMQAPLAGLDSRVLLVVGGAAAALSVRVVRRRAQGLILGAVVAGAYSVACIALGLLLSWEPLQVFERSVWGSVNGIASALLAMGFLPLFEAFTRITTDQTLLELADLNRPLLKRLSLEASGTYAHSINVANLAEAAARAIDANPLLVRVGAYYHDIGKISMPQYFIENQPRGRNPHDLLDPASSAAIVRGHVLEGIRLADQAKLPDSVKVFIPEHHGTQSIGFFFDQARQNAPDADLDPADFAYPGPKPRTKETAILMLADSVESASKVLQDPTPERIRALVDRIVDSKISQGQLEEAPLNMREVTRIREQLAAILNGMYHHRIDYPPASLRPREQAPTHTRAGQVRL